MPGRSVGGGPEAGGNVGWLLDGGRSRTFALAALIIVGALAGCGGGEEGEEALDGSAPLVPEEAESVVVRVSGTEGVTYSGNYSAYSDEIETFGEELETVEGALGDEPTEYEVKSGAIRGVTAFFQKTRSGGEKLKAEIVADDEVILESTTYADLGETSLNWLSPEAFDQVLPEGELPEEELPEEFLPEGPPEEGIFGATSIEESP